MTVSTMHIDDKNPESLLSRDDTALLLVDVQGNLARVVQESDAMIGRLEVLLQACRLLDLPIIWLEQNPRGLGPTVPEIAGHLDGLSALGKQRFGGLAEPAIATAVADTGRSQWLVAGVEAHVCVYQSVAGLVAAGKRVQFVSDAMSSRRESDRQIGMERMRALDATATSVETCIYELLGGADDPQFRQVLKLVR